MLKKLLPSAILATGLALSLHSAQAEQFQVDGENCLDSNQYPKPHGAVNDYADLLDQNSEDQLTAKIHQLEAKTTDEVAILTVKSLQGQTVEAYAKCLGTYWGVGKKGQNNGVLFLVASDDRKTRIQTGAGIQSKLTDMDAAVIIQQDSLLYFKQNQYQNGIISSTDKIIAQLDGSKDQLEAQRDKEEIALTLKILALLAAAGAGATALYHVYKYQRRYFNIRHAKDTLQEFIDGFPETDAEMAEVKLSQPSVAWQKEADQWNKVKKVNSDDFSTGKILFNSDKYNYLIDQTQHTEWTVEKIKGFRSNLERSIKEVKQVFAGLERDLSKLKEDLAEHPFTKEVTDLVAPIEQQLSNIRAALAKPTNQTAWGQFFSQEVKPTHERMLKLKKTIAFELKILAKSPEEITKYREGIRLALENKIAQAILHKPAAISQLQDLQTQLGSQSPTDNGDPSSILYYYYFLYNIDANAASISTETPHSHYSSDSSSSSSSGGGSDFSSGGFGGGDMGGGGGASGSW